MLSYITYLFDNTEKKEQQKYTDDIFLKTNELECIESEFLTNNKNPRFDYDHWDGDVIDKVDIMRKISGYDNFDMFIQNSQRILIIYYNRNFQNEYFEEILSGTEYDESEFVPIGFVLLSDKVKVNKTNIQFIEYIDTFISKRNLAKCMIDYIFDVYNIKSGTEFIPRQLLEHVTEYWEKKEIMKLSFNLSYVFKNKYEFKHFMKKYNFHLSDKINNYISKETKYIRWL